MSVTSMSMIDHLMNRSCQWEKGSIRGLGWSEDEKLLVITEDGTVRCYYNLQGDFTQFSLGHVSRFGAETPVLV